MSGAYDQALKRVWRSNAGRLARLVTGEPVGQVRLIPTEQHQVLRIPDLVSQGPLTPEAAEARALAALAKGWEVELRPVAPGA